jgi:hypothetical protein
VVTDDQRAEGREQRTDDSRVRVRLAVRVIWWAMMVLLCSGLPSVRAAAPQPMSLRDLANTADLIVFGEVVVVAAEGDESRKRVLTRIELRILEVLKGPAAVPTVSFVIPGGKLGEMSSLVADAPTFGVGERVVVFLAPRRDGQRGVAALFQGKFSVERDPVTGQEMAVRRAPGSGGILDRMPLAVLRSEILTHERQ